MKMHLLEMEEGNIQRSSKSNEIYAPAIVIHRIFNIHRSMATWKDIQLFLRPLNVKIFESNHCEFHARIFKNQ